MSFSFTYIKQISDFLLKLYSYSFGWFLCEFYHDFFCYPDPDQRFLRWIRIRPNDTDPTIYGSETLVISTIWRQNLYILFINLVFLSAINLVINLSALSLTLRTLTMMRPKTGWSKKISQDSKRCKKSKSTMKALTRIIEWFNY